MIDKDTLRTARRTVERNGYTVLPPRDRDERDLDRFRTRREVEREDRETRPAPRYREVVRDEDEKPVRKFKPLRGREDDIDYEDTKPVRRTREVEDDYEETRPTRRARDVDDYEERPARRPVRQVEDDYDDRPVRRPARPVYREEDDYEEVPRKPARREMNDDEKLGAAIRTAEENGFTIRKMSRLDQAKQIARDNGYEVRRMERPTRPTAADYEGNDKPARPSTVRPQRTLVKPTTQPNVEDGIRTRTAPDTEIAGKQPKAPTGVDGGNDAAPEAAPAPEPKKNTYADDFMNRAAKFFGEEEQFGSTNKIKNAKKPSFEGFFLYLGKNINTNTHIEKDSVI